MSSQKVDARGKTCPVPLVMTKKVFDALAEGQKMQVVVDNDTSAKNIETFVCESGGKAVLLKDGVETTLTLTKGEQAVSGEAEVYCSSGIAAAHVIYVSSDRVSEGENQDLGLALMQTFLQTIKDIRPLPSHVIFMHRGVTLLKEGTKTAEAACELKELGVGIIACGTCLDYFKVMDQRACGKVSNMYDILSLMTTAGKIIKP